MKNCSKCKENKEFSEFGKSKYIKDGYKSACKVCLRADNRLYYDKNSEKESVRKKKQYIDNKEIIDKKTLEYYHKNKDKRREYLKKKREEQPEVFKEYKKQFTENNPTYQNNYVKNRRKIDPLFKLQNCLRNRLLMSLKYKSWNKNTNFSKYIGCTLNELKDYLESKFQLGMDWSNHGRYGWHIDHIIPLDSAETHEELYKLCHYTNLQPLWATDNLKKSNK